MSGDGKKNVNYKRPTNIFLSKKCKVPFSKFLKISSSKIPLLILVCFSLLMYPYTHVVLRSKINCFFNVLHWS